MRTFIAADFPPEIINKIDSITNYLKTQTPDSALKWVSTSHLHLTIKFIGNITSEQLDTIKKLIRSALQNHHACEITIEGLGMYPNSSNPRVIWLGVTNADPLIKIHQDLERILEKADIEPESRDYNPHLTIARVHRQTNHKTTSEIGDTLSKFKVDSLGSIKIDQIRLYQSQLTSEGPVYTPLLSVPLNQV